MERKMTVQRAIVIGVGLFGGLLGSGASKADEATIYQSPSGSTYSYFYRDPASPYSDPYVGARAAHEDEQRLQSDIAAQQRQDNSDIARFWENQRMLEQGH